MPLRSSLWLAAAILTGCSLFGDDDPEIEIRTDARLYVPIEETVVSLTVSNKSNDPIFYICTGQIYLEELDADRVTKRWMIHGFEECLGPGGIDSESKKVFELGFDKKSALGNLRDAAFDEHVRYRMTVDLFWDRAFKRALSDVQRRSNTFQILRNPVL